MLNVLKGSWALFLGVALLMIGNALQGSLLGVRSVIEGMPTEIYGYVSAGYFAGFLGGSMLTPLMLRRVGHIRVFAALGSMISAAFIFFALVIDPVAWFFTRFVVGFCYSGVYIVAESWINDGNTNQTRGRALSVYMFIQMTGVVIGQQLLNVGDPAGYDLFILMSILVSVSFAPILLSVSPAPLYEAARPMTFIELYRASPLGCVGVFLIGGAFAGMFGMSAVYAAQVGFSLVEISIFVSALYLGAVFMQMPIGWLSDRMDRRWLIIILAFVGSAGSVPAILFGRVTLFEIGGFPVDQLYFAALIFGGLANPIYGLLLAHTNDFLENDQMAAAGSGLVFLTGVGALGGPIIVGYAMTAFGSNGFWFYLAAMLVGVGVYGLYRTTQRATVGAEETGPFIIVQPRMTAIAADMLHKHAMERMESEDAADGAPQGGAPREVTGEAKGAEAASGAAPEEADARWAEAEDRR